MLTTLLALRTDVLDRSDMDSVSGPITTAQANQRINTAIAFVYGLLCKARGDEYFEVDATPFTTVSGTQEYALPSDFLKLSPGGVWWIAGAGYNIPIHKYNPNQSMDQLAGSGWSYSIGQSSCVARYRLRKGFIRFVPIPMGAYSIQLKYLPRPPVLALDGDPWDGFDGFEEAVKWHAAASCKAKEESDNKYELEMFNLEVQRIMEMANRDENEPPVVQWCDDNGDDY